MMKKAYTVMLMISLSAGLALAGQGRPSSLRVLKMQQKQELRVLKLKQEYARNLLENSSLPKAVRNQMKHELKREERKLREKQKDERQGFKDRQRLLKLETKELGSE